VIVVRTMLALLVLVLALAGCGDAGGPSLCASANDYVWYGKDLAGRSGTVPQGKRAERDVEAIARALEDLAVTVPAAMRDEVGHTRRYWAEARALLASYDYGAGPREVPEAEYQRLLARYTPNTPTLRLTRFLVDRCGSTPFPTPPAG
jgi:hypothetical protein